MFIKTEEERIINASTFKIEGYIEVEFNYSDFIKKPLNYWLYSDSQIVVNPDFEKEEQQKKEDEFNSQFFNTSLGYVRRKVTMQNGRVKEFLTDILPLLVVGVDILTYDRELNPLTQTGSHASENLSGSLCQSKVSVTAEFLNECKQQLLKDFYGDD